MTITEVVILFVAAVVGGTLNAVAGGGSFVTFPALVFTGVPPDHRQRDQHGRPLAGLDRQRRRLPERI